MRKTSDMASLLGSRGRSRSRGGFLSSLRAIAGIWFGGRPSERRGFQLSGAWVAGGLVAAFAVGYLVGDRFGGTQGVIGLDAKERTPFVGTQPGFQGEFDATPKSSTCFVVALYPNVAEADAKAQAKSLSEYLRAAGLKKVGPYFFKFDKGSMWGVAVYYDGMIDLQKTRQDLLALPESVPDATFTSWRASRQKDGKEWPETWAVR